MSCVFLWVETDKSLVRVLDTAPVKAFLDILSIVVVRSLYFPWQLDAFPFAVSKFKFKVGVTRN